MGGFAAAIGGAGQAAQEYGKQIRSILEQRRGMAIDFLTKAASEESDPGIRGELHGHLAKFIGGGDMAKIVPALIKTVQKHEQSNAVLAQLAGGPPQSPKPQPAPAQPGQTPGTLSPMPDAQGAAAQPATSPIQQPTHSIPEIKVPSISSQPAAAPIQSSTQPVTPPPSPQASPQAPQNPPSGLPGVDIQQPMAIIQKYMGHPMWAAPANRSALEHAMTQELSHNEAIRQAVELSQANLQMGLQRLNKLGSPEVVQAAKTLKDQGMPEFLIPTMIGRALGIEMPATLGTMGAMFNPIHMSNLTGNQVWQNWPEYAEMYDIPKDDSPVDAWVNKMTGKPTSLGSKAVRNTMTQGFDAAGNAAMGRVDPFGPAGQIGPVGGFTPAPASAVSARTGVHSATTPTGQLQFKTAKDINQGNYINPAMMPVTSTSNSVRSVQTVNEQGTPVTRLEPVQTSSTRSRVPGGVPPVSGASTPQGVPPAQTPPSSGAREFAKPLTSSTQTMREAAPKVRDLVSKIRTLVDAQKAQLGPLASRWSEFWAGKVGAPNSEFTKLRTDTGLLQTLLMRMHVGARGGTEMMLHFKHLIDTSAQSPENLKAALDEIESYSQGVEAETPSSINPSKSSGGSQPVTITLPSGKKVVIQ